VRALLAPEIAPALQQAMTASPEGPFAVPAVLGHLLLGLALQRQDPTLLALGAEAQSTAARLEPWRSDVLNNYGVALVNLGRLEEAEPVLREAIRLAPTIPSAHLLLGSLLERQGRRVEAEASFAAARRLEEQGRSGQPAPR
jgi:Tfp pilus assembly protein PilF